MRLLNRRLTLAGLATGAAVAVLLVVGLAIPAGAARTFPPHVFEQKLLCCKTIVLGPQSSPTQVTETPGLPVGTYLVHATVGVVIGPNDNVVCATAPASIGGNDGIFGGAGNGATESGTGPAGVYATVTIVDTWTITKSGDRLEIGCNVGHFGQGTYASQAVIAAVKLGSLTETQG
jgi:hypothetical protein